MSSILKALRRLEEERARKSHSAPEIAASLLRRGTRRRQLPLWVWPAVITVVALTVALFLWSLRPTPELVVETPSQQELVSTPAKLSSSVPTRTGGVVIIEEVMDQRQPVLLPPPSQIAPSVPLPVQVKLALPKSVEVKTVVETSRPVVPAIVERQRPVISAIAWQEDASARMAVVNGLPVMTGESVDAAKIREILRDRILFEENGMFFTVRMNP